MRNAGHPTSAVVCALLIAMGCTKAEQPFRKVVVPVKGLITVDGRPPSSPLKIECHSATGLDAKHPTVTTGMTTDNGQFALSTYETGDGVPAGDYSLTFMWGQMNLVAMSYSGPDKLKKRYSDPAKSTVKFTAVDGKPVDLGTVELTTR